MGRSNQWSLHSGPEVLSWTYGTACRDSILSCVYLGRARPRPTPDILLIRPMIICDNMLAYMKTQTLVIETISTGSNRSVDITLFVQKSHIVPLTLGSMSG